MSKICIIVILIFYINRLYIIHLDTLYIIQLDVLHIIYLATLYIIQLDAHLSNSLLISSIRYSFLEMRGDSIITLLVAKMVLK